MTTKVLRRPTVMHLLKERTRDGYTTKCGLGPFRTNETVTAWGSIVTCVLCEASAISEVPQ